MKMYSLACVVLLGAATTPQNGCDHKNQVSDSGVAQVKSDNIPVYKDGKTYEQWSINQRQQVTNDPTKLMWIHLIDMEGDIVKRMPVRCKTTSSMKRLKPNTAANSASTYLPQYVKENGETYYTQEIMKDDGTFGESDAYKYWFDPMGRYHEIGSAGGGGMSYLLTDYPIDLEDSMDSITGLYKVHEAARAWQDKQEAKFREEVQTLAPSNKAAGK